MRRRALFALTALGWAQAALAQGAPPPLSAGSPLPAVRDVADCAALARAALPDAIDLTAQEVAPGALALPADGHGMDSPGMRITGADPVGPNPAFCKISATLTPSPRSAIRMQVWLPAHGWNGKLIGVGNFGWGGSLPLANMAAGLARGYAVAGNDTGHDSGGPDGNGGRFLLGNPDALVDYAWRANHAMTVAAKDLIRRAYGTGPVRSYWIGCSLGGLQGLIEARRFPEDYDGVVAGAPPNPLAAFNAAQLWPNWLFAKDPRRALSERQLGVLHAAVLKACAGTVGQAFGYVEDPLRCTFDPVVLACKRGGRAGANCLTPRQVAFVRAVYRGPVEPRSGAVIFPGPARGSEQEWRPFVNGKEFFNAADLFRYAAFADPAWRAASLDWQRDVPRAIAKLAPLLAADDDLTAFAARGGRLLLYVGGNDYHNPAELADYLKRVQARIGEKGNHYARLFVIPGMGHCGGSQGCDAWDKVDAIDAWVDRKAGLAPREVAKTENGAVIRRQPLCYYPQMPVYRGSGDPAQASSYQCQQPAN